MGHHQVAGARLAQNRVRHGRAKVQHLVDAERARQQHGEQEAVDVVARHQAQNAPAAGQQARQFQGFLPQRGERMGAALRAAGTARGAESERHGAGAQPRACRRHPVVQPGPRQQPGVDVGPGQVQCLGQRRAHAEQFQRIGAQVADEVEPARPWQRPRCAPGPGLRQLRRQQVAHHALHGSVAFPPVEIRHMLALSIMRRRWCRQAGRLSNHPRLCQCHTHTRLI
jgi:hypothetical protein